MQVHQFQTGGTNFYISKDRLRSKLQLAAIDNLHKWVYGCKIQFSTINILLPFSNAPYS